MRKERITNRSCTTTKTLAITTITITVLIIINIFSLKAIKARTIVHGSHQLNNTSIAYAAITTTKKSSATSCDPTDTSVNATKSSTCKVSANIEINDTGISGPSSLFSFQKSILNHKRKKERNFKFYSMTLIATKFGSMCEEPTTG
jgi:hypothetical protein